MINKNNIWRLRLRMAKKNEVGLEEKKIVTKYDRKVQRRKEEALKEAKRKKITIGVLIALALAAVIGCVVWGVTSYNRIYKEYIKVDDDSISGIEFDFYYGISKNENLSQELYDEMTFGDYYTSYLGYDVSKSDRSQNYSSSEDTTWFDYFANNALNMIKEYKAILADADKNAYTYNDFDKDYEELVSDISKSAEEAGISVKEYYKSVFGKHATQKNVKPFIEEYLKATAYAKELETKLAASDEEIKDYYEENKDTYDQVTFRQFVFTAEEEGDEASIAAAKEKADAFAAAATDETKFAEQCRAYAASEDAEKYESDDASLLEDTYKTSVDAAAADWVFESGRTEGDVTVIEDTDNSKVYVLYFVSREYDDENDEKISEELLNESYTNLIKEYTDKMSVDNINNRIKMLSE